VLFRSVPEIGKPAQLPVIEPPKKEPVDAPVVEMKPEVSKPAKMPAKQTAKQPAKQVVMEPKKEPVAKQTEMAKVDEPTEMTSSVEATKMDQSAEPAEKPMVEMASIAPEQATEIVTGSSVIIRKGDSLWRVSRRRYGLGIRYTTIFEANRDQIRNPHLIFPGQVFDIPEYVENN